MNREQLFKAFLEDDLLKERGYLKDSAAVDPKWSDFPNEKICSIIRVAIEGVLRDDSQAVLTRKINLFLEA